MKTLVLSAFADEADPMLASQIEACRRNGIHQIEMRGVNGKPFVQHTEAEAREVRRMMDDAGMRVWALGSPFGKINIRDPFQPHLDAFKHALSLAHIVGTTHMRIFSFYMPAGEDPATHRSEVLDRLDMLIETAHDADITVCHENEKGIYGDNAERCIDLLTVFAGRMGGIFDPANFIQCGVEPRVACHALKPFLKWMHIKDALREGGRVVPAGHGDGALPDVLPEIIDAYEGEQLTLSIEPHLSVFKGLQGLEREGEQTNIPAFTYRNNQEAFDAAAGALRSLLSKLGYHETKNEGGIPQWIK